MDGLTVLKRTAGDVKRLSLDVREAFFLSQIDGELTLDEVALIVGLDVDEAKPIAERLVRIRAASITSGPRAYVPHRDPRKERASVRPKREDPRVENTSLWAKNESRVEEIIITSRSRAPVRPNKGDPKPSDARAETVRAKIDPRVETTSQAPTRPRKNDPRAERASISPAARTSTRPKKDAPTSMRPSERRTSMKPDATSAIDAGAEQPSGKRSKRSAARRSMRPIDPTNAQTLRMEAVDLQRAANVQGGILPPAPPEEEACDLDAAMLLAIADFDARVATPNLYARLGLDPSADKKAIKRAYCAFVAKYHPDRFFKKKVGAAGPALERIFHAATEAHDTLVDAAQRAAYDATWSRRSEAPKKPARASRAPTQNNVRPPRPSKAPKQPSITRPAKTRPSRAPQDNRQTPRPSKAPKQPSITPHSAKARPSRAPTQGAVEASHPAKDRPSRAPTQGAVEASHPAKDRPSKASHQRAARPSRAPTPSEMEAAAPRSSKPPTAPKSVRPGPEGELLRASARAVTERMRNAVAGARLLHSQRYAERFIKLAEDALAAKDVVAAANNYRLALEHSDDPHVRQKLEEVDLLARAVRFDRSLARARGAEKDRRWQDAATHFQHAFQVKRDAAVAERAANALREQGGAIECAIDFARKAVAMRGRNADFRLTLAETLLAADELDRAKEEVEVALSITPDSLRAKEMLRAISKRRKAKD